MTYWRANKWRKRAECFIFISNNVLGALQFQMKHSSYLLENADLEVETDEDKEVVNAVCDIVLKYTKR